MGFIPARIPYSRTREKEDWRTRGERINLRYVRNRTDMDDIARVVQLRV